MSSRPFRSGKGVTWRVWAPRTERVELVLCHDTGATIHGMTPGPGGWFETTHPASPGQRYAYSLDGGPPRPDPSSLHQPDGVHHPSALFFAGDLPWQHPSPALSRESLILYELHIGTFTGEGTFDAAIRQLDALADLGITALEIMPVAQCPGKRNWGYDGVHPFATQDSYGGPAAFQRFIDAAHGKGLLVFLDVVFNHAGPEGNYLSEFAPYFTGRHPTPWGPGFDYDGPDSLPVRHWVLDCVHHWIHDFRLDGLRLDAVHAMEDSSSPHILTEIKTIADHAAALRGGSAFVIAESLVNDPVVVTPVSGNGLGLDAEWNEDFHHAVTAWMTRETSGKYADYGDISAIETVLRDNLHLTGQHSRFYDKPWGKPAHAVPGDRFLISLQNHDHVGNRSTGERLASQVGVAQLRLGACLTMLAPFLPMLFMGEEYGETNPFLFFCDFQDRGVIRGVREGRQREFSLAGKIPDPLAESSFESSKLSWQWTDDPARRELRELYRSLIALRRDEPALREFRSREVDSIQGAGGNVLRLIRGKEGELTCFFNLSETSTPLPCSRVRWRSGETSAVLAPFETVVFRSENRITEPAPDA